MKLESLNNSKYSLTPEKMGELVGGKIKTQCTAGGERSHGRDASADYQIDYTGSDIHNNILQERYLYFGANDVAARDNQWPSCQCK